MNETFKRLGREVERGWNRFVAADVHRRAAELHKVGAAQRAAESIRLPGLNLREQLTLDQAPRRESRSRIPLRGPVAPPGAGSGMRIGPEGSGADLEVKGGPQGAQVMGLRSQAYLALPHVVETWRDHRGPRPVITSGNDGRHRRDSRHYLGQAIDIRGNNLEPSAGKAMARDLQTRLGPSYFVQFETFPNPANNHLHLEYDPKPPR